MVGSFICGGNSLPREEEDHKFHSADSSPRKSSSRSKNPYSDRGLDRFTVLLAEIEEKRQKIYSELDPDEISLVRFVYSNDNSIKPIVVMAKGKRDQTKNRSKSGPLSSHHTHPAAAPAVVHEKSAETAAEKKNKEKKGKLNLQRLKQPCYYLPAIVMLVLLFLALFGRSVAILCTSLGWYLVPTMTSRSSDLRRSVKKKDYSKRLVDNKKSDRRVSAVKTFDRTKSAPLNEFPKSP
ncbi:hypothetical protein Nepgr_015479 [Nepenthes gracilis]|uniref:ZCF37 n=2 Tax=Nepenthes gracilis TaxID=150966 RepID=A0AAD3SL61_NEPGR|nr:hypothetical protein Nepgr_015479 [Nepenthes gracilis]